MTAATAAAWSPSSATKTLTRHLKINAFDRQTDFQMYKEQEQQQQQKNPYNNGNNKKLARRNKVSMRPAAASAALTRLAATPAEAAADETQSWRFSHKVQNLRLCMCDHKRRNNRKHAQK